MKNVVIFGNGIYSVSVIDINRLIKLRDKYERSNGDTKLWNELYNLETEIKNRSRLLGKALYKA